jgi:hypothetical protein
MIRRPAVREVMDLICERVDVMEMSYPEKDERERYDSYEGLKILTVRLAWLGHILGREYGPLISNPPGFH